MRQMGQVTIEYFLLFAAIALVTIISLTRFDDRIARTVRDFFGSAARCMSPSA